MQPIVDGFDLFAVGRYIGGHAVAYQSQLVRDSLHLLRLLQIVRFGLRSLPAAFIAPGLHYAGNNGDSRQYAGDRTQYLNHDSSREKVF